jgi:ABC-type multidrug transport system fused ATPase/permease subunit
MVKKAKKNIKTKGELMRSFQNKLLELEMELRHDVSVPIVASFGFIIALVWRDAIKGAIDEFLIRAGLLDKAYIYNFVSAFIVTIIVIVIMIAVTRFSRGRRRKKIKKKIKNIEKIEEKLEEVKVDGVK